MPAKTINYNYNPDGSLGSIDTPAGSFAYNYDAVGRPTSLSNPYEETTSWTYDNIDRLATQTIKNSLGNTISFTSYGYDGKSQLTDLVNRSGSGSILSRFTDQTYDTAGNLLGLTADIPGAPTLSGTTSYTYNVKDQLTQELSTRNGNYQFNFDYDTAGNPILFKGASRSFNYLNQNDAFAFDLNGNPTTYKGNTLTYDIDDNLTGYGSLLSAGYDSSGLRVWKDNGSVRTHFLYAGGIPVCEMDASGNVIATNTFGANGLVSRRTGGASDFFAFDPQGSVTQQINSDGTLDANNLYDAYGNKLNTGVSAPFGYGAQSGYYTDPETGLMLLTHRYYDPTEGRFLTRDPIGYAGGMNLYGYCYGNPIGWLDPSGLIALGDPYWFDTWGNYISSQCAVSKDYYLNSNLPWVVVGSLNTCTDIVGGYLIMPQTIGHFGEGAGYFSADPGWDTAGGLANDVIFAASVGLGAASYLKGGAVVAAGKPAAQSIAGDGAAFCAGKKLGDLTGKTLDEAITILNDSGFIEQPKVKGSTSPYRYFKHQDGSRIDINTNDLNLKVSGPKKWASDGSKKFRERYGPHNHKLK